MNETTPNKCTWLWKNHFVVYCIRNVVLPTQKTPAQYMWQFQNKVTFVILLKKFRCIWFGNGNICIRHAFTCTHVATNLLIKQAFASSYLWSSNYCVLRLTLCSLFRIRNNWPKCTRVFKILAKLWLVFSFLFYCYLDISYVLV